MASARHVLRKHPNDPGTHLHTTTDPTGVPLIRHQSLSMVLKALTGLVLSQQAHHMIPHVDLGQNQIAAMKILPSYMGNFNSPLISLSSYPIDIYQVCHIILLLEACRSLPAT
ncbi:unnamed protein product [Pleuronectes platessa]|uniref:Uncharacterized protein n=1 Tax=Pleuronectes platessa TaxID=8262 RepID=A0A9N7VDJ3_PLEPL|nr:unnamed protein product [Pleuronectes platessa]